MNVSVCVYWCVVCIYNERYDRVLGEPIMYAYNNRFSCIVKRREEEKKEEIDISNQCKNDIIKPVLNQTRY